MALDVPLGAHQDVVTVERPVGQDAPRALDVKQANVVIEQRLNA